MPPLQIGAEFKINTQIINDQDRPWVAALTDGGFVVTWRSQILDGSGYGVFVQRYDAAGQPVGGEFQIDSFVDGRLTRPHVEGLQNGGFVVTWAVAGRDGNTSDFYGNLGVYGQVFDAQGHSTGPQFLVNSQTDFDQYADSILSLANGNFVVAWESRQTAFHQNPSDVRGQLYNPQGHRIGGEFIIATDGLQDLPSLAALSNGGFVATWDSWLGDSSYGAVYGQVLNANGERVGDRFLVNTTTEGDQGFAQIVALPGDAFMIVWVDHMNTVMGRLYNPAGQAVGAEFHISTDAATIKEWPSATLVGDHEVLVTWQSGEFALGWEIVGRRLDLSGHSLSDEFTINSTAQGYKNDPAIATLKDGSIVATWASQEQDGSGYGVYGEKLFAPPTLINGTNGKDILTGTSGADLVLAGDGNDTANGLAGDDQLFGGNGDDNLGGEEGNDILSGGNGNDKIHAGEGNGDDILSGGDGNDLLFAFGGDDVVDGDNGNDTINSGGGNDIVEGGNGNDIASYNLSENIGTHAVFDGGNGRDTLQLFLPNEKWIRADVQATIANYLHSLKVDRPAIPFHFDAFDLIAVNFERLEIYVDGQPVSLRDDPVHASNDNATIFAYGHISGNVTDNDSVPDRVANVELVQEVSRGNMFLLPDGRFAYNAMGSFNDLAPGETATETFIYKVTDADGDSDTATATITILGPSGGNSYRGGSDDDRFVGSAFTDIFVGGGGNDTYVINAGDRILERPGEGIDLVETHLARFALPTSVDNLTFLGVGAFEGKGNGLANVIIGGAGNDRLIGARGNDRLIAHDGQDILDGGVGADIMSGGAGGDTYYVDNAGDGVVERANRGVDHVIASIDYTLGSYAENLTLVGAASGGGNKFANLITGSDDANTLNGMFGLDHLEGGGGDDMLTGGRDSDSFVFKPGFGHDTITDFAISGSWSPVGPFHDILEFDHAVFADLAAFIAHSADTPDGVLVTADAADSLLIHNATLAKLQAHPQDFHFV